jgi:hypothetical protein
VVTVCTLVHICPPAPIYVPPSLSKCLRDNDTDVLSVQGGDLVWQENMGESSLSGFHSSPIVVRTFGAGSTPRSAGLINFVGDARKEAVVCLQGAGGAVGWLQLPTRGGPTSTFNQVGHAPPPLLLPSAPTPHVLLHPAALRTLAP